MFIPEPVWELPLDPAAPNVELEALQPQQLLVSVEIGREHHAQRVVLAQQEVRLVADQETSVLLTCALPPDAPQTVPLTGTLTIPPGWETASGATPLGQSVTIRFELKHRPADFDCATREILGQDLVATEQRGPFRWTAGDVLPGNYVANVRCGRSWMPSWTRELVVGPTGNRHVELKLPPPAELIVHVVPDSSSDPAAAFTQISVLTGTGQPAPGTLGYSFGPGPHRLLLPVGPVLISATWPHAEGGFQSVGRQLQLRPGRNEVTLERVIASACA